MVPEAGLEPATYWLQVSCSTNWAIPAYIMVTRTGFEPVYACVKGMCVKPLHQRAIKCLMARPRGVEPLTFWSVVKRSIQLSYGRIISPRRITSVPVYNTRLFLFWQVFFSNFPVMAQIRDHLCLTFHQNAKQRRRSGPSAPEFWTSHIT